ncbi:hypothetical protein QOZ80_2AG0103980 [Eleusine coracana subsp. coracana]|nr:hypothetical protein QOZ80_2AG0103980 [Eleusine coracana subsp. coracana]
MGIRPHETRCHCDVAPELWDRLVIENVLGARSGGWGRASELVVGSIGEPQLTFPIPLPRSSGQRPRKKLKLPEVQQLVRSLEVENKSLREEMRFLQRACTVLSKENDKLEIKLERSNSRNENASKEQKGNQQVDQQSVVQSARDSFVLPDLNLPPQDTADVSLLH